MPGHKRLHDRVVAALDRCQESQAVEFKESASWGNIKDRTIRAVMAMNNLRDGGVVVVGASESGSSWSLTGVTAEHLASYRVDDVIDGVNRYASPAIEVEVVIVEHGGKEFLAIQVPEFGESPCVCRRSDTAGQKPFAEGDIYIRPPGKAQTKRVTTAQEIHDLLELAAEKRARRMIATGHRIGMAPVLGVSDRFDDELEGL